jgi:hypothetical protein
MNGAQPAGDPDAAVQAFRREIAAQEDLLYGFALFFEGIGFLYAGREALILTHRKELRNVIQAGRQTIEQALALLAQAEKDPSKVYLLQHFKFSPGQSYPQPAELCRRARVLVDAYNRCFPGRPRSQPFSKNEILRLLNSAAEHLEGAAAD